MKLAIGSGVAFHGLEPSLYTNHDALAARARWWQERGAAGIVFYDTLPDFYTTPVERVAALRAVLAAEGLAVPVFNALRKSLHDPARTDPDERRLAHCLAVSMALGIDIIDVSVCMPLPTGRAAQGWEEYALMRGDDAPPEAFVHAASRLTAFAQTCASANIQLAIELHDDGIHDTAANCLKLAQMIAAPNVGLNPDLGNWYRVPHEQPGTWRDQLTQMASQTIYWEVKNYGRAIAPLEGRAYTWPTDLDGGDIDFREAATILVHAGFDGWVCHEGGHGDRVTANIKYLSYFRWILHEWMPVHGVIATS